MWLALENTNDKNIPVKYISVLNKDIFTLHRTKICVKPTIHTENDDYHKYSCPICDNLECNHPILEGQPNCNLCGINFDWRIK